MNGSLSSLGLYPELKIGRKKNVHLCHSDDNGRLLHRHSGNKIMLFSVLMKQGLRPIPFVLNHTSEPVNNEDHWNLK